MPINGRFTKASTDKIKRDVPKKGGVYELKAFGEHVYIGKADNLQRRILEHYSSSNIAGYRYETAGLFSSPKGLEDKHLTKSEERHGRLPKWNNNDTRN